MKPMRKGTRSCRECRRRKIKCNWPSSTASTCIECSKSGRTCVSQGYIIHQNGVRKSESSPKITVNLVESVVERIAKQQQCRFMNNASPGGPTFDIRTCLQDLDQLDEHAKKSSPLYGLFNNEVITQSDTSAPTLLNTLSVISFGKDTVTTLQKLQSTISQEPSILEVLDVSQDWWISWRDQAWALRTDGGPQSARDFVERRLDSTDPVVYATGLLCVAMALQHLPLDRCNLNLNLSETPATLVARITAAVDQTILTDSSKHEMTILVCLQRAKIHAEDNQLRKSWLRIRHAILMITDLDYASALNATEDEMVERQRWVGNVYEMDHFMSLVLGFPHAIDENFKDDLALDVLLHSTGDDNLLMRALRRVVAVAAGRINERNAKQHDDRTYQTTTVIEETLGNAASHMPSSWWNVGHHLDSSDSHLAFEHLMAQLWFWQIQAFLHLPFMLRVHESPAYQTNHRLCLQGCRNMLRIFCSLRDLPAFSMYICTCDDFQGVLSACTLLVGLLLQAPMENLSKDSDFEDDFLAIQDVKEVLRYRSQHPGGTIAKQGLRAVETLESFLNVEQDEDQQARKANIILPYFGLINVEVKTQPRASCSITSRSDSSGFEPPSHPGQEMMQYSRYGVLIPDESQPLDFGITNDSDWLATQPNLDWDHFLYGNELAQDWGLCGVNELK